MLKGLYGEVKGGQDVEVETMVKCIKNCDGYHIT